MKKLPLLILMILFCGVTRSVQSQVTMQPESDTPDLVKVYVKQDPATYQKSSTQNNAVDFAVQVSASSKPIEETAAKKEWDELGHVFVQKENGLYKVRIGPYATQMEAKETLLKAKSKGKKDAFIVVLQGTANDKPSFSQETAKKPSTEVKPEKKVAAQPEKKVAVQPEKSKPAEVTPSALAVEYKVRVASYQKPGSFNPNGIDHLGKLESYRKGDMTIMMIGGFKNLEDAQKAKDTVVSKGYKDAAIVVDHNGILEEVVAK